MAAAAIALAAPPEAAAQNILVFGPPGQTVGDNTVTKLFAAWGYTATTVDGAAWGALTQADFESYDAIYTDGICGSAAWATTMAANQTNLMAAVTGRMYLSVGDPDLHTGTPGPDRATHNALEWATAAGSTASGGQTGLVFHSGCNNPTDVFGQFTSFGAITSVPVEAEVNAILPAAAAHATMTTPHVLTASDFQWGNYCHGTIAIGTSPAGYTEAIQCDDGNIGVLLREAMAPVPVFYEDFSDNSAGWTLGTEWQIGPAVASPSPGAGGNGDPGTDFTPTADNGVAGMVIGGNISNVVHPYYYLTSPAINTTTLASVELSFRRWLNQDYTPFMQSQVEVWNGSAWVVVWASGPAPQIKDSAWTLQAFDITAHSNAALQVRIGLQQGSNGAYTVSAWNLDDVKIDVVVPPTVASPTSALITGTTATLGGDVTGGSGITERGVVYAPTATNPDPELLGIGVTKVPVIGTTGVFTTGVTGLSPLTSHSFKAFATNALGTGYTSVATFTTTCPTITLASLPNGNLGAVYAGSAAASGGTGPYTYAVTSGSLPGGLSLTPSGAGAGDVGGTPSATATFPFDITATDTSGAGTCTGVQSYSVVIGPELGQDFFSLSPCRVLDTRNAAGPLGGPALVALDDRIFLVSGTCGIPADAKAISLNIAVTGSTNAGNIRLHAGGTAVPLVSAINYKAGQTRSNNAVIPLGPMGTLAAYLGQAAGTAHLILDVNGYFK